MTPRPSRSAVGSGSASSRPFHEGGWVERNVDRHVHRGQDREGSRAALFESARGARTFGEIGHGVTVGRYTHLIVNKFSTMTQKFIGRIAASVRTLRTTCAPSFGHCNSFDERVIHDAVHSLGSSPYRPLRATPRTPCRHCCAQENGRLPTAEKHASNGARDAACAALRFKQ